MKTDNLQPENKAGYRPRSRENRKRSRSQGCVFLGSPSRGLSREALYPFPHPNMFRKRVAQKVTIEVQRGPNRAKLEIGSLSQRQVPEYMLLLGQTAELLKWEDK